VTVSSSPVPPVTEPDNPRPERADAARNRELILTTARRCFAERGISVTLNDIAHEAGVGVGTVYRKFPDKDSLIEALLTAKFAALTEIADRALAIDDPRESLRSYLWGALDLRARDRAIAEVILRGPKSAPAVVRERTKLDAVATAIVQRAQQAGVVRSGFDARDIPILTLMMGEVADRTKQTGSDVWRRYAQLLIDAVCPPVEQEALLAEPLDMRDIEQAMHRA
jgi:AcrR family transcriptional regulator